MGIVKDFANSVSKKNRERKFRTFCELFSPSEHTKICDLGPTECEIRESDNMLEKRYQYPENITAIGIDKFSKFSERYPRVTAVTYDGRNIPFPDNHFDILYCNAVIEHLGTDQLHFVEEACRVANRVFMTTPNYWFPIEVHTNIPFAHYFGKRVFKIVTDMLGKSSDEVDGLALLSYEDIRRLLKRAGISDYKIKRNRFLGFTMDFVIII